MVTLNRIIGREAGTALLEQTEYRLIPSDETHKPQRHNHLCNLLANIALGEIKFFNSIYPSIALLSSLTIL
jgi:hypothetical protein